MKKKSLVEETVLHKISLMIFKIFFLLS